MGLLCFFNTVLNIIRMNEWKIIMLIYLYYGNTGCVELIN